MPEPTTYGSEASAAWYRTKIGSLKKYMKRSTGGIGGMLEQSVCGGNGRQRFLEIPYSKGDKGEQLPVILIQV